MAKRFFKNVSQNFCVYLLTVANITHAIVNAAFDWLLWLSIALCALSIILCAVTACRGVTDD